MDKQAQLKALAKRMKPMHLKMAIALGEGKNQTEAYIAAGGKAKNKADGGHKTIASNCDISIYAEMAKVAVVEEAQERGVMTFQAKTDMLEEWMATLATANGDKGMIDAGNALKAMAEHNRMTGDLAAIKTDNKTAIDLSGYSDAQLAVMADG